MRQYRRARLAFRFVKAESPRYRTRANHPAEGTRIVAKNIPVIIHNPSGTGGAVGISKVVLWPSGVTGKSAVYLLPSRASISRLSWPCVTG